MISIFILYFYFGKNTRQKKISMLNLKRLRYGSCCPAPAAGHPAGNADLS